VLAWIDQAALAFVLALLCPNTAVLASSFRARLGANSGARLAWGHNTEENTA
jgi:hypothetical protein